MKPIIVKQKSVKQKFGQLLMIATFGATGTFAFANEVAGERAEAKEPKESFASYAEKDQKEIDAIIGELTRQHNNASTLVKTNREPVSLATQSALVAHTPKPQSKTSNALENLTEVASSTIHKFKQVGTASWYGRKFHGKKTASGERFDMNAMTAAHRSLPLNCYVRVTNKDNGKSVVVRINDRGPFHGNRIMDLSYGAAKALDITQKGMGNVIIERIDNPNGK